MKPFALLAVVLLVGCTINMATPVPEGTFRTPPEPITFPGLKLGQNLPALKDERPIDQRLSQSIREHSTTTMLIGDDVLVPSGLRILAAKLANRLPQSSKNQNIAVSIFLVSVWGRSPEIKATELNLITRELYFMPVPVALVVSDVKSPTAGPSGYSADMMRVSIYGEVDGVTFSAKDSRRLSGTVSHNDIREMVGAVTDTAVEEILRLIKKGAE